jgi:hypothetical protein
MAPARVPDVPKPAPEPVRPRSEARDTGPAAAPRKDDDDDQPPKPPRKGKGGRPRDVIPAEAIERLRAKGGKLSGNIITIGKALGSRSKTSAHRLLGELHRAGLITMQTGRRGVAVALA